MPSKTRKDPAADEPQEDPTLEDPEQWRVVWRSYDVTLNGVAYTFGDEIPIPLAEARARHDCSVEPRVPETHEEA